MSCLATGDACWGEFFERLENKKLNIHIVSLLHGCQTFVTQINETYTLLDLLKFLLQQNPVYALSSFKIATKIKIGIENDKIALIMNKAYKGITKKELSDTDFLQFWLFSMLGYRRVENIYLQYKNGFLTYDAFDRIGMGFYQTPLQREIWEERKDDFDPEFAIFFEELRDNQ